MIPILCFSTTTTIQLPKNPDQNKPEKHVFKEIGYVCHNKAREKAINDKLTTQKLAIENACAQYREKALDISPEVNLGLFPEFKWGEFTVGLGIGAALIYYLKK